MTTTVDLVYFNAGGGHRAAAQALQQVMSSGSDWNVRIVNLTDVLDPTALFRRCTGMAPEDLYNKRLASGFTLGLSQELKLLQRVIRYSHAGLVQRLVRHWQQTRPGLVVSLIPNFNRALHDALALACPDAPFVTVLTDMADHPPRFWIEPGLRQHVVCGTAHAEQQALEMGCDRGRVHRASGMILRPCFYGTPPTATERVALRQAQGLDAHTPTGLVLFGGAGSAVMKRIALKLPHTPLILMCGRNAKLADELRALPAAAPRVVVGYTDDVPQWMRLADFFIGKPGPGSVSEAVQMGLPVIVTRNAWTMPQERWNTQWVQHHGVGVVLRSFAQVQPAVDDVLLRLPQLQQRVRSLDNEALFDVPRILRSIVGQQAGAPRNELLSPA